jgi:hypothetical protein
MVKSRSYDRPPGARVAVIVTLLFATLGGCRACSGGAQRGRSTPVCAVQDCASGKTIDDGCSDDGRCLSCINPCPPPDLRPGSRQ